MSTRNVGFYEIRIAPATYVFMENRGDSNEYPNICFYGELTKIIY